MNKNHDKILLQTIGEIQIFMPVVLTLIFSICAGGLAKVRDTEAHSTALYSSVSILNVFCILYANSAMHLRIHMRFVCYRKRKYLNFKSKDKNVLYEVMISEHKKAVNYIQNVMTYWLQHWHLLFNHRSDCWPVSHGNERQSKIHCNSKCWSFGLRKMCAFNRLKLPGLAFHRVQWFKLAVRGCKVILTEWTPPRRCLLTGLVEVNLWHQVKILCII